MKTLKQRLLLTAIAATAAMAMPSHADENGALGLGVGVPYGGIVGVSYNYPVADRVDLVAGVGNAMGFAWNLGAKYFLQPGDSGLRLSAFYGTNATIETVECHYSAYFSSCTSETNNYNGLTAGFGWGHRAHSSGWNADLLLILTSEAFDEADRLEDQGYRVEESGSRLALSFGYHWAL